MWLAFAHTPSLHICSNARKGFDHKRQHISNFQQLSKSQTSFFTLILWGKLQFLSAEGSTNNCKSCQHSRLWQTSTLTYSPEAMLMISLTIASWASSYSSLFFIYSSLTELSLLWTKPQYLEAVMFCLHCYDAKLLVSSSMSQYQFPPPVLTARFSTRTTKQLIYNSSTPGYQQD